jgi:hypothetical protein
MPNLDRVRRLSRRLQPGPTPFGAAAHHTTLRRSKHEIEATHSDHDVADASASNRSRHSGDRTSSDTGSAYIFDFTIFMDSFESGDTSAWSHSVP